MAQNGHEVSLFEKNETIGGRARVFEANGFLFDMGPSWYWMPDVFEQFFKQFGKGVNECYALVRLDPGFQMIFANNETVAIPASLEAIYELFEGLEKGSSAKLKLFLAEAKLKYAIGMGDIIRRPFISWSDFLNKDVVFNAPKLQLLSSHSKHVRKYFKDERIIALMEFPVLFLGAMSQNLPALYSLMNYAAIEGGTWYPMGGMYKIVEAMKELAVSLNVKINTGEAITLINVEHGSVKQLVTTKNVVETDAIIATGDYHHIEEQLLKEEYRNYNETYWQSRTFAPSCLIFYLGVRKRVKKLIHHNL
ncbi:MAG: phytoene desaturase, partial [Chitinophagia bacterium]|nr:phytoene desaturase [Chitinophagia bacterium]